MQSIVCRAPGTRCCSRAASGPCVWCKACPAPSVGFGLSAGEFGFGWSYSSVCASWNVFEKWVWGGTGDPISKHAFIVRAARRIWRFMRSHGQFARGGCRHDPIFHIETIAMTVSCGNPSKGSLFLKIDNQAFNRAAQWRCDQARSLRRCPHPAIIHITHVRTGKETNKNLTDAGKRKAHGRAGAIYGVGLDREAATGRKATGQSPTAKRYCGIPFARLPCERLVAASGVSDFQRG